MPFNLEAARAAGYTDDEILGAISQRFPRASEAKNFGYSVDDIVAEYNRRDTTVTPEPEAKPSAFQRAIGKGKELFGKAVGRVKEAFAPQRAQEDLERLSQSDAVSLQEAQLPPDAPARRESAPTVTTGAGTTRTTGELRDAPGIERPEQLFEGGVPEAAPVRALRPDLLVGEPDTVITEPTGESRPFTPEEEAEAQRRLDVQRLRRQPPRLETNPVGAALYGIAGSIAGPFLPPSPEAEAAQTAQPLAFAVGELAGNIAQVLGVGSGISKSLAKVAVSPFMRQLATRVGTSLALNIPKNAAMVARNKKDFSDAFWDTLQQTGGAAISIIPEVTLPANVVQLIGQPAVDLAWDALTDAARGRRLDKNWLIRELPNLALSTGFAIRDVASGQTFKLQQQRMRADLVNWSRGKGKQGWEIVRSDESAPSPRPVEAAPEAAPGRIPEDLMNPLKGIEAEARAAGPKAEGLAKRLKKKSVDRLLNEDNNTQNVFKFDDANNIANYAKENNIQFQYIRGDGRELKAWNTKHGNVHAKTDAEIKKIWGDIYAKQIARAGGILTREGGDEFIAILPNRTTEEAELIIDRIQSVADRKIKQLGLDNLPSAKKDYNGLPIGTGRIDMGVVDGASAKNLGDLDRLADEKMANNKLQAAIDKAVAENYNIVKDKQGKVIGFEPREIKQEVRVEAKLRRPRDVREPVAQQRPKREPTGEAVPPKVKPDVGEKVKIPPTEPARKPRQVTPPEEKKIFKTPHKEPILESQEGFTRIFSPSKPKESGIVSFAKGIASKHFTSKGNLPQKVFENKISRDGEINYHMKNIERAVSNFRRASKEAYGSEKLTDDQAFDVDLALKGEKPIEEIPTQLQPIVKTMRSEIDALSQRMIDEGLIEGDLAGIVSENIGFYATRAYRVFDDPNWAKKVTDEVKNNAKAFIRQEYPDLNEAEVNGLINNLLYKEGAPVSLLASGTKLGSKNLAMLKRRKVIPAQIRALWGEYKNADVNYARSVSKMANAISNQQFLKQTLKDGENKFLFKKPTNEFAVKIAADQSSAMAPLNGLYTTKEINEAFIDALEKEQVSDAMRLWYKINGSVKYAKTIGSWMTHARNVTGNIAFAVANGHFHAKDMRTAFTGIFTDLVNKQNKDIQAEMGKLIKLGVLSDGARAGEIRAIIKDATQGELDVLVGTGARAFIRRILRGIEKLYGSEDDVWKWYAYRNEFARYRKALPDMDEAELERRVANIVRNTYPTYSMIPRAIKKLRRFPLFGTFVSFPSEVIRTGTNTISLAAKELRDPKLRAIGAQRLTGLIMATLGTGIIGLSSKFLTGTTKEKEDAQREFLPPWTENQQIIHLGMGSEKKPLYIDLGYADPHSYLKSAVIAFMRGDNWQNKLYESAAELLAPFSSEDILAQKLLDIKRNKTEQGNPVYNPQDPEKYKDIVNHLADAFLPGTISGIKRMWLASQKAEGKAGTAHDLPTEAVAQITGVRVSKMDIPRSLAFKTYRFNNDIRELSRLQRKKGRDVSLRQSIKIYDEFYKTIEAAYKNGMTKKDVVVVLSNSGMSKTNIGVLLSGKYPEYLKAKTKQRQFQIEAKKKIREKKSKDG